MLSGLLPINQQLELVKLSPFSKQPEGASGKPPRYEL
jgi:hypothetical protein